MLHTSTNKYYQRPKIRLTRKKFSVIQAAFNSFAGFDDGSNTPKTYKEVMKLRKLAGWWA
jgi:hypothetical protein